jgi:hypothetical protein
VKQITFAFVLLLSLRVLAAEELCSHNLSGVSNQARQINSVLGVAIDANRRTAAQAGLVFDPFYNEAGCFSPKRNEANACTHPIWTNMDMLARAEYVRLTYEELLAAHGLDYSPRILTCKAVRESCLRPQDESSASNSTASGLAQVTRSTAADLFRRGEWFTPKVRGFEEIDDGRTYHARMSQSMAAQLELGMAVLHQKSIDHRTTNIRKLLEGYYGHSAKANKEYSDRIYDCAACIQANDDRITTTCLRKARASCFTN